MPSPGYPGTDSLEAARAFAATLHGGGLAAHQQFFPHSQELDGSQRERQSVAQSRQAEVGTGAQEWNQTKGGPKGGLGKAAGKGKDGSNKDGSNKPKTKGIKQKKAKATEADSSVAPAASSNMWVAPGILQQGGLLDAETENGLEANKDQKSKAPLSGGGPKRTDYIKKFGAGEEPAPAQIPGSVPITTMMLKNIPCRKTQEDVMAHIDQQGFLNKYDFFYLPRDVKFRANLGYAFINFVTPEDAAAFTAEMNGYRFAGSGSTKACAVVPAHVQGLQNNLAAFKRTEVMRSSRKPFFSSVVTF